MNRLDAGLYNSANACALLSQAWTQVEGWREEGYLVIQNFAKEEEKKKKGSFQAKMVLVATF